MTELVYPQSIDAGTEIDATEHAANYTAIRDIINGQLEGGSGSSGNFKANGVTARELADILLQQGIPSLGRVYQEGIMTGAALKVTPGSGLVLNYASGTAWVADDSGVIATGALLPCVVTGSTVTIAANASGNPRIDQVVLTVSAFGTGTVSVVQGTATGGATLDNRSGAAALPAGAIRLADILMPNGFAGPFVQNTHIRDRRGWACGANHAGSATHPTATMSSLVANTWTDLTGDTGVRLEIQSTVVIGYCLVAMQKNAAGLANVATGITVDGGANTCGAHLNDNVTGATSPGGAIPIGVTPGSHTFKQQVFSNVTTMNIYIQSARIMIQEIPAPQGTNEGA